MAVQLSVRERIDLIRLVGDKPLLKTLANHYATHAAIYKNDLLTDAKRQIRFGDAIHKPSEVRILERLTMQIMEFDGKLYSIATHPAAQQTLALDYRYICGLFAKNVLAIKPVLPGDSL